MCIHVYVELLKGLHIYKQWKPNNYKYNELIHIFLFWR
jgi:hypothetical protein